MNKILRLFISNKYRFCVFEKIGLFYFLSDKQFLKIKFKNILGYNLNLDNPYSFNEKIQWLKLYDRKELYTDLVDKYKVREYIGNTIGNKYLIPLIGCWSSPEEIDFEKLPNQFVLKCNHNSGTGMYICKDKSQININKIKKDLRKGMKENYYKKSREWPYKNVPRRIIAEHLLVNEDNSEIVDYKLMCFNGKVKCSFVCNGRFSEEGIKVTFFDNDWNVLPFERHYPKSDIPVKKPKCFDEMRYLAEKLSKNITFVRVDFYEVNGQVYFGEMTFYPGAGFEEFTPESADYDLGSWLDITNIK